MKLQAYSIRDIKSGIFNPPTCHTTHGEAERWFRTIVNRKGEANTVSLYPEDFSLFHIGEYDDNTGLLTSLNMPKHMVEATQLLGQ